MHVLTLETEQPSAGTDVTRLWLAPGLARIAVVFGNTIRFNGAGLCWDTVANRALWRAALQDDDDTYPDPDFDRDLTRVTYVLAPEEHLGEDGDPDNFIGFCEIPNGSVRRLGALYGHLPAITPDGRYALAAELVGRDRHSIRRWELPRRGSKTALGGADVLEREPRWALRVPEPPGTGLPLGATVSALVVSRDGGRLAAGQHNGAVTVWNTVNRRAVAAFPALKGLKSVRFGVHRLVFSPDGGTLAAVRGRWANKRYGFQVHVWSLPAGAQLRGPKEKANVNGVAFSPDGRTLLTAREDGSVGEWDTATWKLRREFAWKIGKLFSVAFAPDGLTCAAGGENGQVVVWDVD